MFVFVCVCVCVFVCARLRVVLERTLLITCSVCVPLLGCLCVSALRACVCVRCVLCVVCAVPVDLGPIESSSSLQRCGFADVSNGAGAVWKRVARFLLFFRVFVEKCGEVSSFVSIWARVASLFMSDALL